MPHGSGDVQRSDVDLTAACAYQATLSLCDRARCTGRRESGSAGGRGGSVADHVVLFGYQDDDNHYYMMFSRYRDNNELFKVVGAQRPRAPRQLHRQRLSSRGGQPAW